MTLTITRIIFGHKLIYVALSGRTLQGSALTQGVAVRLMINQAFSLYFNDKH